VPEQLLDLLQLCLLVLLYLFFAGVLRVVWVEVDGPRRAARRRTSGGDPVLVTAGRPSGSAARSATVVSAPAGSLVVLGADGTVSAVHPLDGEIVVGRAPACTVVLDDGFASQRHARFVVRDGVAFVEDLRSTNGTLLDGRPVQGAASLTPGSRVQIGSTVLEFRP
jgi:hypothetical protein